MMKLCEEEHIHEIITSTFCSDNNNNHHHHSSFTAELWENPNPNPNPKFVFLFITQIKS